MRENSYFTFILHFFVLIGIICAIFGLLCIIPSPDSQYNSYFTYTLLFGFEPLINSLFNNLAQSLGFSSFMGGKNSLLNYFGLSNNNINNLTYSIGVILLLYALFCFIGIYKFNFKKKLGWYILFILSIPLIPSIFGIFNLNYLSRANVIKDYLLNN
ncbi:MAG: hypothetical protein ACTSRP_03050 [Candidatus Helarchaeota archaeon]